MLVGTDGHRAFLINLFVRLVFLNFKILIIVGKKRQ
jgi:hypothetical protein